jgi:hypothetical protein
MSHTRAEIDRKLELLEARARDLTPRRLSQRYLPEYALDQAIGAGLTLLGLTMAWRHWRNGHDRHLEVREALEAYGRW